MYGGLREKDNLFAGVKVSKGKTLGFGYLRLIPEAVFQPNKLASVRDRSAAMKVAVEEMKKVLVGRYSEAVLFAESLEFAELLCAHFDGTQIDAFPVALEVK